MDPIGDRGTGKQGLRALLFGRENRIGRRIVVLVIAFSSLITLSISVVQLLMEYRSLRESLDRHLEGVAIYLPTIAGSVWDFDEKQIQRAIEALVALPEIVEARVVAADTAREWVAGDGLSGNVISKTFPLRFRSRGEISDIGVLTVTASLDGVYRQVLQVAAGIVLGNALKTLLVAFFMVFLIRKLVTVRLEAMADKVRALVPGLLPLRLAVENTPEPLPVALDELDSVNWTLDKTASDLAFAVTALDNANENLERRVQERTRELESFSYSVSHDLRTPLRAIDGFSKILIEDYSARLDDEGQRLLRVVRDNTERMGQLIDDILRFSRIGRQDMVPTAVDMQVLAEAVVADLRPSLAGRHIEFALGPLPSVEGDAAMLRQVLVNLIGNAVKFTRQREDARVDIGADREGGGWVFRVRDNGAGFDMRYADKLFRVFERLHGQDEYEGTGIGLAIVQQIVARHGGRVWAEGKVGEGAVVFFTLGSTER